MPLEVRCEEVLGGATGPPWVMVVVVVVVAVLFMAGVFSVELFVWGVVGVFGDAPLLERRDGRRALPGDCAAGDCC